MKSSPFSIVFLGFILVLSLGAACLKWKDSSRDKKLFLIGFIMALFTIETLLVLDFLNSI